MSVEINVENRKVFETCFLKSLLFMSQQQKKYFAKYIKVSCFFTIAKFFISKLSCTVSNKRRVLSSVQCQTWAGWGSSRLVQWHSKSYLNLLTESSSHAHSIRNQSLFVKLKKPVSLGTWSEKEKLQYG